MTLPSVPRIFKRLWTFFRRGAIRYDYLMLSALALGIGLLVGLAAIGFRWGITAVQGFALSAPEHKILETVPALPGWQVPLALMAGGLAVGLILRFGLENDRPESVADVMNAAVLKDGRMNVRRGLASAAATVISLGSGASAGREGPMVHLGATISAFFSEKLRLTPAVSRTLLACGVASAVAASFNAPIAGVFFALEVIMGHYALHTFTPVVISSVAGTLVSRAYFGDFPAFIVPQLPPVSFAEFPAFLGLGLAAAIIAALFMNMVIYAQEHVDKSPLPVWTMPVAGGILVAAIAHFQPEILGVGYEATNLALQNGYGLTLLVILLFSKILATAIALGFRFGGGIFSPSLFIGAMAGGAYGLALAQFFPAYVTDPRIFAIAGMGAVASATLGAPISTILIVFELTGDYTVTIAVMIASAIAALATALAHKASFFHWQLERRGIFISAGKAMHLIKATGVKEIMDNNPPVIPPDTDIERVRRLLVTHYGGTLIVADGDGRLIGTITAADMRRAESDETGEKDDATDAASLSHDGPVVTAKDSLETAFELMEGIGEEHIPVIRDPDSRQVIGILHYRTVMETYTRALSEANREARETHKSLDIIQRK